MEDRIVKTSALHFYPKRIMNIGVIALSIAFALSIPLIILLYNSSEPFFLSNSKTESEKISAPLSFSLGLNDQGPVFPSLKLQEEMTFSFDPPRPDGMVGGEHLLVRMKKSAESKRVVLPCRLDLEFQRDKLKFAKDRSSLWIELSSASNGQIEGKWFVSFMEGKKVDTGAFVAEAQGSPIQGALEFAEGSPFRSLAEARSWGQDLFKKECSGERIEVAPNELVELQEGHWLVWKGQKWEKGTSPEKGLPIARVESSSGKGLILEGWDKDGHIRICLAPISNPPFKPKGEELFSSLRIRSEKQISCVLEKQCMVLKVGDWVAKTGGRWKILRKKEERDAFLHGKLFGEFFIFEQIFQKQGQKMIQGRIFNPGRTQVVSIEMAAQSTRSSGEKRLSKGMKR